MARRSNDEEDDVSLFPFLSILACVIGTLTLMITAMAIGQMDTPEVAQAEEAENIEEQLAEKQDEVKQLETKLRQSAKDVSELWKSKEQLAQLQDQLNKTEKEVDDLAKKVDPNLVQVNYEDKILELQAEKATLADKLKVLRDTLDDREEKKEGVVQVRPGGSGVDLEPTFVECREEGIIVYDGEQPHPVASGQIGNDVQFLALLDEVAESENRTITFLLRDNGIANYYRARGVAQNRFARNGKLPVMGKGKLDLSLFTKKK